MSWLSPEETLGVLLVEDSREHVQAVEQALGQTGRYRIRHASRMATAVELLARDAFDVALVGFFLADSQGLESVIRVREAAPSLPIVILTARDDREMAREALSLGAEDFITTVHLDTDHLDRILRHAVQRRQIHSALEESDQRFRDFAASASDWFWETDENLRFTHVSGRFERNVGVATEQVIGLTRVEWAAPKTLDEPWRAHLDDLQARRPFQEFEYSKQREDGQVFHFSVSGVPVFNSQGAFQGYRGVGRDITQRVETDRRIAQNAEFQRVLNHILHLSIEDRPLDDILDGILDAVTDVPFLSLDSKGCVFTVENSADALQMRAHRNLAPVVIESCAQIPFGHCICGRAASERRVVFCDDMTADHKRFSGNPPPHGHYCVPIVADDRIWGVLNIYVKAGHARDEEEERFLDAVAGTLATILKRKQAEDEVRRNHRLLDVVSRVQSLFIEEPNPIKVFDRLLRDILDLTDSEYGFIGEVLRDDDGAPYLKCYGFTDIAWNEETRKLYEESRRKGFEFRKLDNLVGAVIADETTVIANEPADHPRSAGLPKGHPPLTAFLGIPLKRGQAVVGEIGLANRPGGYDQALVDDLRPVLTASAQIIEAYRTERARSKAEQALFRSARELRRTNSDLEEFAYAASHDLQEPLRTISSYLDLIRRRYWDKLDPDARDFINFSIEGGERLHQLIGDLLTYSRVGRANHPILPVDLEDVVEIVLETLDATITDANAQVKVDELPILAGDGVELGSLFQNLITNAIKYRAPDRVPQIRISASRQDEDWLFTVRDNGIGIPEKYVDRIFLVFQRLHSRRKYKGTGIGLAICKKIVERHGGKIWVESVEDQGTTFLFTLPNKTP